MGTNFYTRWGKKHIYKISALATEHKYSDPNELWDSAFSPYKTDRPYLVTLAVDKRRLEKTRTRRFVNEYGETFDKKQILRFLKRAKKVNKSAIGIDFS